MKNERMLKMKRMRKFAMLCAGCLAFSGISATTQGWAPQSLTAWAEETEDYVEGNLKYKIGEQNVTVSGLVEKTFEGELVIPSEVKGLPVTKIGEGALYDCTGLKSIIIPDSVTSIGQAAFGDCTGLTSITIPDSVTSIGRGAFSRCNGLTSITYPSNVTGLGYMVFSDCKGLTSITFPDSVTKIGYGVFYGCTGLTSIAIPDSVTEIDSEAFYGCTELEAITIPESVLRIGSGAFSGTKWLEAQKKESPFVTVNHILIDATSVSGNVTVTDGITSVSVGAFSREITGITFPDSVTALEDYAFANYEKLKSLYAARRSDIYSKRSF